MDWLLNLIPGGGLGALIGGIVALLAGIGTIMFRFERAGVNKQKAKEAARREEELRRIKFADRAKPTDSVLNDPNNRDLRKRP
jgi:hypothetical protein